MVVAKVMLVEPEVKANSENPTVDQMRWLGSMEGIPEWDEVAHEYTKLDKKGGVFSKTHSVIENIGSIIPGISFAVLLAFVARHLSVLLGTSMLGFEKSPISPIIITVILGILIRNTIGIPDIYIPGLKICIKRILRIGIALLGLRLSVLAMGQIGLIGLPVVFLCIVSAIAFVTLATRILKLPSRLGTLIAVGTSICGVSAVVATAPGIDAEDDEVSYAVACVTLFGMIGLILYPYLAHWVFSGDAGMIGMFLGTSIHDTSQVAGAGLIYQQHYNAPEALDVATVTKLVRNLCMIWVIPLLTIMHHRAKAKDQSSYNRPKWFQMIPLFVIGFVAMSALRSIGDIGGQPFGFLSPDSWEYFISHAQTIAKWCLVLAMASVGMSTSFTKMKMLGIKPVCVGFVAALSVGVVSFLCIRLIIFIGQ